MTLKQLKYRVHQYLDAIWLLSDRKVKARTLMYKWLATQMNIPEYKCHVRFFNRDQCKEAIKILQPKYIQIIGHDLDYKPEEAAREELNKYMEHIPTTVHLVNTIELQLHLSNSNIIYDSRPKIEDLNLFKQQLKTEVDNITYKKLETFIENYLKFYNK